MNSKEKLKLLKNEIGKLLIIHYSCQSLDDDNQGYSPRITSIAIQNVDSEVTKSYSIHLIAEEEKIPRDEIDAKYDALEKKMLEQFYEFVGQYTNYNWLHWNMDNVSYGFEAIAHRYKILSSNDAPNIPDSKRFNLSFLVLEIYGENCVDHPRMQKLMEINGGVHRDFLSGKDEATAFVNKEYFKLHKSTLCKVDWFRKIFMQILQNKLKTQRSNWPNKLNNFVESTSVKCLSFVAVLFTLYSTFDFVRITYLSKPASPNNYHQNK